MRKAEAQISLRIRAAWSGPCCPLTESLDTIECVNREQVPGWDVAHARDETESVHLRRFEDTFSLDAARA